MSKAGSCLVKVRAASLIRPRKVTQTGISIAWDMHIDQQQSLSMLVIKTA